MGAFKTCASFFAISLLIPLLPKTANKRGTENPLLVPGASLKKPTTFDLFPYQNRFHQFLSGT
jgi:hypothetical protein